MIPIVAGVADLSDRYDVWFCDIWGVMHNGHKANKSAVEACEKFRRKGGRVVLITNAPRPFHSVADQLVGFGVPVIADEVMRSGMMLS